MSEKQLPVTLIEAARAFSADSLTPMPEFAEYREAIDRLLKRWNKRPATMGEIIKQLAHGASPETAADEIVWERP